MCALSLGRTDEAAGQDGRVDRRLVRPEAGRAAPGLLSRRRGMCRPERARAAAEGGGRGRQLESGDRGVEIWRENEEGLVPKEPDHRRVFIEDVDGSRYVHMYKDREALYM